MFGVVVSWLLCPNDRLELARLIGCRRDNERAGDGGGVSEGEVSRASF